MLNQLMIKQFCLMDSFQIIVTEEVSENYKNAYNWSKLLIKLVRCVQNIFYTWYTSINTIQFGKSKFIPFSSIFSITLISELVGIIQIPVTCILLVGVYGFSSTLPPGTANSHHISHNVLATHFTLFNEILIYSKDVMLN